MHGKHKGKKMVKVCMTFGKKKHTVCMMVPKKHLKKMLKKGKHLGDGY